MPSLVVVMLHTLWVSGLVSVSAAILMKLSPSAPIRYGIASISLAVCAACPIIVSQSMPVAAYSGVSVADSRLVLAVWLAGVFIGSCRLAADLLRVRRMIQQPSLEVPEFLWKSVRKIAARLGVGMPERIILSATVAVPGVVGGLRYTLLLPLAMVNGLRPGECEAILAHELAHARRWDFVVNLVQRVVEIVWFFNPAVWWLSGRMRIEREFICDQIAADAMGNGRLVAGALATLATTRREPGLVATATGGSLIDRVQALTGVGKLRLNVALPIATALVGWLLAVPGTIERPVHPRSLGETMTWKSRLERPANILVPVPMPAIEFPVDIAQDVTRLVDAELAEALAESRVTIRMERSLEGSFSVRSEAQASGIRTIEVWAVR